jgi:hypothetical protein
MLIDFHELAQRNREKRILGGRERIDTQSVFQPRDQHSEAKRVETAIREYEILFERRQNLAVLPRYLFHLFVYG